jgi:hypothetical protein
MPHDTLIPHTYDYTCIKSAIIVVTLWQTAADNFSFPRTAVADSKHNAFEQQKAALSWSGILATLLHMSNLVFLYHDHMYYFEKV